MRYLLIIILFLISRPSFSSCPDDLTVDNEYIIKITHNFNVSQKLKSNDSVKFIKSIASFKTSNDQYDSSSQKHSKLSEPIEYETLLVESDSEKTLVDFINPLSIQKNCYVKTLSANHSSDIQGRSEDPLYFHQKWYLDSIKSFSIEPIVKEQAIIVAVTDTGVDINHRDLKNQIWVNEIELNGRPNFDDDGNGYIDDIYGYDVADNDNNPAPSTSDYYLDYDHGTHVSGLIGAEYSNGFGTRGVTLNQVEIMAVKGFRSKEKTKLSDLIESIYYSVDNGAHIINASWGVDKEPERAEIDAVNYALDNGVLIVAAAGNSGDPASWVTPGSIKGVVTVGSINSQNQMSTFSNYGNSVDFVAPGGDGSEGLNEYILSAALDDYFIDLRGTSMSAPFVSGALALTLSQRADLKVFQALRALYESADSVELKSSNGRDKRFYKKINIEKTLQYIETNTEITPLDPRILSLNNIDKNALESKSLSSQSVSKGSTGCSMNHKKRATLPSALLSLMFLILPSTVLIKKRRRCVN